MKIDSILKIDVLYMFFVQVYTIQLLQSFFYLNCFFYMKYNICKIGQTSRNHTNLQDIYTKKSMERVQNPQFSIQEQLKASSSSNQIQNFSIFTPEIIANERIYPSSFDKLQISQPHRAKMRLWITQNSLPRGISRKVISLANHLLDLYLIKKKQTQLNILSQCGLCCLIIANKLLDNTHIRIGENLYNRSIMLQLQSTICFSLSFDLNPLTFTDLAECLTFIWKKFGTICSNRLSKVPFQPFHGLNQQQVKYVAQNQFSSILLDQLLQFASLFYKTFNYPLDSVVFNSFALVFFVQFTNQKMPVTQAKVQNLLQKEFSSYKIIRTFIGFCRQFNYNLSLTVDQNQLQYLYPIYNCMISECQTNQENKFNPNDIRLKSNCNPSSNKQAYFKDKLKSYKTFSRKLPKKKQSRKFSELTSI